MATTKVRAPPKASSTKFLRLLRQLSQSIQLVEELSERPDTGIKIPSIYLGRLRFVRDCVSGEAPLAILSAADLAGWTAN